MEIKVNKIYCTDCLPFMKKLPDKSIDLIFTSPPYNMRLRISKGKYIEREKSEHFSKKYKHFSDALPINDFYKFHKACITEMLRVSKITIYNFQIVTGSKEAFFRLIGEFSKEIRDIMIWDKGFGQPAMNERVLNSSYEFLLILEDGNLAGRKIKNATFKRGELSNVIRCKRGKKISKEHSATFPMGLAETIIKNFSKEGDLVLDPFSGTGTVGLASLKLKRNFILIERERAYVDETIQRFKTHLKGKESVEGQ